MIPKDLYVVALSYFIDPVLICINDTQQIHILVGLVFLDMVFSEMSNPYHRNSDLILFQSSYLHML